ncbi:MAG: DUF512 domain-containing protein [Nitrospira sp.]|nr:DUF512 domain-containing protein [bacterium]MBL7049641.1 DUF512 domain-containing protein [Nitrospira sp.]
MKAIISNIEEHSIAHKLGIKKGDALVSINGNPVEDIIDYMFHALDGAVILKTLRGKTPHVYRVKKNESMHMGIELRPFRTRSCRNKCMFCFVDQLPKGMRKSLYVKDDDYRMSFLYGNYITLTGLSAKEKKRIVEQRLSPLYISVHSTNNEIRRKLLGSEKAPDILDDLQFMMTNRIKMHVQIVVCPGINDGEDLSNTIKDLQKFYPYLESIAVVPVGLTKHKKADLKPFIKENAIEIIEMVKGFRRRFKKRFGDPVVYLADELYIKAETPLPPLKEYGDLSQLENGVGLVPLFLSEAKRLKLPKKTTPVQAAVITGVSFAPFLEKFAEKLRTINGVTLEVFTVDNKTFGPSVTVTGLLTGKDILKAVVGKIQSDCLLIPDVTLREGTEMFLDNVTMKDLAETLGITVKAFDPTPEGLLEELLNGCQRQD